MRIKTFENFNREETFENEIYNLPLSQRQELKNLLLEMPVIESRLYENIFTNIKRRLTSFLRKKVIDWLINLSEKELDKKIDNLTILDPEDFSNIKKCQVLYLGGAIDKTSDESAKMWREEIESFFGDKHILKDGPMNIVAKTGKLTGDYEKPIIVNPMRNELVRWDDHKFAGIHKKWKTGELNSGEFDPDDWKYWAKITNKNITAPDRRIISICDTNLVCMNNSAGAGTLGELELGTITGLNHFIWLTNGYKIQDISPWLVPGIKKIVRNKTELYLLLNKIKNIN